MFKSVGIRFKVEFNLGQKNNAHLKYRSTLDLLQSKVM
jgi:hypothetical protein